MIYRLLTCRCPILDRSPCKAIELYWPKCSRCCVILVNFSNSSLEPLYQLIIQTWHETWLGKEMIQICSNEEWYHSSVRDNSKFSQTKLKNSFYFECSSKVVVRLSICKLCAFVSSSQKALGHFESNSGIKHSWMKGFQVCSNERPHPFPKGENNEKAKMHWQNFKIFSPRKNSTVMGKGNWNLFKCRAKPFSKGR